MTPVELDIICEITAILLALTIILRTVPLLKTGKNPMTAALFLFAVVSVMLSFAYWLAYTWIRPEARMPFAANEIGEIAWFLLLASALESVFPSSAIKAKKETILTLLFAAASVALWIAWSGEWVQDIICGLAFGRFLVICVRSLKQTEAMNKTEWRALGLSCAVIIFGQTGTILVPEGVKKPLDIFCYVLMFAVLFWLLAKSIRMIKQKDGAGEEGNEEVRGDTKSPLAMSFVACAFSFSTMYMSSGWFYLAALVLCLVTLPLMFIALRREVTA